MGTLVLPIGSATVAIPAAIRWRPFQAVCVLPARLNIAAKVVEDDENDEENVVEDQDATATSGAKWRI